MEFNKAITIAKYIHKIYKKIGIEEQLNFDSIIDSRYPQILSRLQNYSKIAKIAICSTNGKKSTVNYINQILEANNQTYITNVDINAKILPILTSIILNLKDENLSIENLKDYYVMAFNEFELAQYFNTMKFDYLLLNNIFIDHKDFSSLNAKRKNIQNAIKLNSKLKLIINADEPMYYGIDEISGDVLNGKKRKKVYFGFNNIEYYQNDYNYSQKNDLIRCPLCGCELQYEKNYYSHLGYYNCECSFKRPKLDYSIDAKIFNNYNLLSVYHDDDKFVFKINQGGLYNAYNAMSAIVLALELNIERKIITKAFENLTSIKARDEVLNYKNKKVKIKTAKNPTSLSECVSGLCYSKNTKVVFALSDDITDGIDTSWIWDASFNSLIGFENKIYVCGSRADDMALRLKYSGVNPCLIVIDLSVENAIECCYWDLENNEDMLIITTPSLINIIDKTIKKYLQ